MNRSSFERARLQAAPQGTNKKRALAPEVQAVRPMREPATHNQRTYMVTTETWCRRDLFRNEPWARLLIDTLRHHQGTAYHLHEFVVMPDHLHILLTPLTSLEKAVQFIKGGFSYRGKRELASNLEVWQKGFADHRIRDDDDYRLHVIYLQQNPVRKHLCERPEDYPYCSAHGGLGLDPAPQGLKPRDLRASDGAAEAAPFQNVLSRVVSEGVSFQCSSHNSTSEVAPLQGQLSKQPRPAAVQTSKKLRTS
jgi:putative transposase